MNGASLAEEKKAYLRDLRGDRAFAELDAAAQEEHLDACLAYGWRVAEDFSARYGGAPSYERLREIAREKGVTVKEVRDDGNLPFLSEYLRSGGARIELFTEKIRRTEEALRSVDSSLFAAVPLKDMCLAHELFHHAEHTQYGDTGRLVKVPAKLFGILPVTRYVACASEIAAHTFVKLWMELPVSPYLFRTMIESIPPQAKPEPGSGGAEA